MEFSLCEPDDAWANATQAGIRSLSASFDDVIVPVEHRDGGNHTINRSQYADGLVLIPNSCDPTAIPAVLPTFVVAGSSQVVALEPASLLDMGKGGVVIFV